MTALDVSAQIHRPGALTMATLAVCAVAACQGPPARKPTIGAGSTGVDIGGDLAFTPDDATTAGDAAASDGVEAETGLGDMATSTDSGADAGAVKPACTGDTECGAKGNCVAGQCFFHTPCQSDKQCQAQGQVCDVLSGECVPCLVAADCPKGLVCKGHVCLPPAQPCASTKECPTGLVCDKAAGQCALCATGADCPPAQGCLDGVCVPKICAPGAGKCQDAEVHIVCNAGGTAYTSVPCGPAALCVEGTCKPLVCQANKQSCVGQQVMQCNATGTAQSLVKDCSSTGLICNAGQCEPAKVCAAGSATCKEGQLLVCKADGTGFDKIACTPGQVCVGQSCVAQTCPPGGGGCDGSLTLLCDPIGSVWQKGKDCAPLGQVCKLGQCLAGCLKGTVTAHKTFGAVAANLGGVLAMPDGGWVLVGQQEGGKAWVVRTDMLGTAAWDKVLLANAGSLAGAVTATTGEIVAAGTLVDKATGAGCALISHHAADGSTVAEQALCAPTANPPVHLGAEAIARRADGGLYVAGRRGQGTSAANDDLWVARLDAAGKVLWQKHATVLLGDRAQDVLAMADGGALAVGYSSTAVAGAGETPAAMLVRYDESGGLQWTKIVSGYLASRAAAIAPGPAGSVWVVGQAQAKDNPTSQSWLARFGPDGQVLLQALIGKTFSAQLADVAPLADGSLAVLQAAVAAPGNVLHLDPAGSVLDAAALPTTKDMVPQRLAVNAAGDLAATTASLFSLKLPGRVVTLCGW
ncbi:MAG: hypothetical protein FJ100_12930 [Deltaproteobacteria bacterium]|nr:hypothetical protein [Deltaproteobacteria bacterium]